MSDSEKKPRDENPERELWKLIMGRAQRDILRQYRPRPGWNPFTNQPIDMTVVRDLVKANAPGADKQTVEFHTAQVLKWLNDAGVKTADYVSVLASDSDRKLKAKFGGWFLGMTGVFALLSYLVVVLDAVGKWGIHPAATTALIIETPLQFIGLLYIVARNLFPASPQAFPVILPSIAESAPEVPPDDEPSRFQTKAPG